MYLRAKRIGVVVIAITLAGVLGYLVLPREPEFEGRSLTSWIDELRFKPSDGSKDFYLRQEEKRRKTESAIRSIGANGLAAVQSMLERRDYAWKKRLLAWLGNQKAAKLRLKPAYYYNWDGIAAARVSGPLLLRCRRMLRRILPTVIRRSVLIQSYSPGARVAVPDMLAALSLAGKDAYFRNELLSAIAMVGADSKVANPVITKLLSDPDEQTRGSALACLLAINTSADEIATFGIDALHDKSSYVRSCALVGLTKLGTNAVKTLPAAVALLDDNDPAIHRVATRTKRGKRSEFRNANYKTKDGCAGNKNEGCRLNRRCAIKVTWSSLRMQPENFMRRGRTL